MVEEVSLSDLIPDPFRLRVSYHEGFILKLIGSILQHGIRIPLLVRSKSDKFEIIDGNYRYYAAKRIGLEKVPVIAQEMSDQHALEIAVISNWHRRNFGFMDKARSVWKLREQGFSNEAITVKLEFQHPKTLYEYLRFEDKDKVPDEVKKILESHHMITVEHSRALVMLKKNPDKQLELAERVVTESLKGPAALHEAKKMLRSTKPKKFKPEVYNVWRFNVCDERFGKPGFPGRIPGQIIQNILYYFVSREDALIVDPMAGSGTTHDVVDWWNKTYGTKLKCLSYDINPKRDFIVKHDICKGFPEKAKNCDLVFLDPPYWRLKRGRYVEKSVSNIPTYEDWKSSMKDLVADCYEALKPRGYVCLLLEAFLDEGSGLFLDLPMDCMEFLKNFTEVHRVSVPIGTQVKSNLDVAHYVKKKIMLDLNRDLIIFRKG